MYVGLMLRSDTPIIQVILSELYHTSRYVVDNDMVIGLAIHHHQLISRVCFVAVSYSHRIPYILMYSLICFIIFIKSGNNNNIFIKSSS